MGDVAWQMRNIETVREKARLVAWLAGEDRNKVREELAGLNQLHAADPELHMMPGHDDRGDRLVRKERTVGERVLKLVWGSGWPLLKGSQRIPAQIERH